MNERDELAETVRQSASCAWQYGGPEDVASAILSAGYRKPGSSAKQHIEYGVFRKGDTEQVTPLENFTFRSREHAEKWLDADYIQPDIWEIRQRVIGDWS